MASINASISSTGLISSGDATGNIDLQSNGTTGLSIRSGGKVVLANTALSTASAGTLEYDGGELYFTPLGTQRGVVPGMQYYRLNSTLAGSNVNTAQNIFGVGVTLSASTVYTFETSFAISKTSGTTGHTIGLSFGGTATANNISYTVMRTGSSTGFNDGATAPAFSGYFLQTITNSVLTGSITSAGSYQIFRYWGTISVNAGGTFIPQYTLSAAPGGAYTTAVGSYFLIYPIGAAGADVNVGTWA